VGELEKEWDVRGYVDLPRGLLVLLARLVSEVLLVVGLKELPDDYWLAMMGLLLLLVLDEFE
jgi:hypothetical protein